MASVSSVTEATFEGRFRDAMSAGADAAAASMENLGAKVEDTGTQIEATEQRVMRSGPTWTALGKRYDEGALLVAKLAQANRRLADETDAANLAVQRGDATRGQADETIRRATIARDRAAADAERSAERLRKSYGGLADDQARVGTSARVTTQQLQQLTPQINDLFVQIAGGQGLFMPLIQQGPQITQIFGGIGATLRTFAATLGPAGLAIAGVTLAVGVLGVAFNDQQARLSSLRSELRGVTEDYAALAEQQDAAAGRIAKAGIGVSRDQANAVMASLRRAAPEGSSLDFEALTRQAADFARILGTDVAQAGERMAQGLRDPAALAKELGERNFPGMTESLRRTVEVMVNGGERGDAFALVMGRIGAQTRDAAKDVPAFEQALRAVRGELSSLWDEIKKGLAGAGEDFLKWLADTAKAKREYREAYARGDTITFDSEGRMTATPAAPSTTPSLLDARLGMIRGVEGGARDPYNNTYGNNRYLANGIGLPLETMSLDDVRGVMDEMKRRGSQHTPVGAYQINRATLDDFAGRLGISGDTLFDKGTQDRIATAIIASVGDPNSAGYLGRLRGRFDGLRNVPDERVRTTFGGVSPVAPGAVQVPEVSVAPTSEDRLRDEAYRIARGEQGRVDPLSSAASQRALIERNQGKLSAALALPGNSTADQEAFTRGLEAQRAAYEGTLGAAERMTRAEQERRAALSELDPVQRELTEAVQQYRDAQRSVGKAADPAEEARIQAERLATLQAQYRGVTAETDRQVGAANRVADAYAQGAQQGQHRENVERALNEVRKSGIQGDEAQGVAAELLARKYDEITEAANRRAAAQQNQQAQRDLEYLEREGQLIGVAADQRERELAAFRARQQMSTRSGVTEEQIQEAERLARATVDQRTSNAQLTNSWNELARVGEQAFERIGSAITEAFVNGQGKAVNFGNIAKAVFSEVVQAGLRMAVINPVLNSVFGGTRGTLGGAMMVAGGGSTLSGVASRGLPTTDGSANLTGFNSPTGSVAKLGSSLFDGGPSLYSGGYSFQGGMLSRVDGAIGTNVAGFLDRPVTSATSASAQQFGPYTPADPTAAFTASGAPANTLTYGQAAAGGLSIAGGAFGIYTGVQQGGAKGTANIVGGSAGVVGGAAGIAAGSAGTLGLGAGAAAALGTVAAVAPYIAAIAAIVAMFLPGQKPSNREGTSTIDFQTGETIIGGQTGKKYSQENREAAQGITDAIKAYTDQIASSYGLTIAGRYQVGVGDRDGIYASFNGGKQSRFSNDEGGIRDLVTTVSKEIFERNADQLKGDLRTAYDTVGTGDMERLLQALDWTRTTYKAFTDNADPQKPTAQAAALKQITDAYEPLIAKAREYGLALAPITDAMDQQIKALDEQRNATYRGMIQDLVVGGAQARGEDLASVSLDQFDLQRTAAWKAGVESVRQLGYGQTQQDDWTREFDRQQDAQRAALLRSIDRGREDQTLSAATLRAQLDAAVMRAGGDETGADVTEYRQQRSAEAVALRRQMEELRFSAEEAALRLGQFDVATQAGVAALEKRTAADNSAAAAAEAQRQAANDNAAGTAAGVISSLADYARGLRSGDASPLGARSQYDLAMRDFDAVAGAAQAGDWTSVTRLQGYSDTLLSASRAVNGSGTGYAADFDRVQQILASVADVGADRLTASVLALETRSQTQALLEELQRLRAEVAALRAETSQQNARPARLVG